VQRVSARRQELKLIQSPSCEARNGGSGDAVAPSPGLKPKRGRTEKPKSGVSLSDEAFALRTIARSVRDARCDRLNAMIGVSSASMARLHQSERAALRKPFSASRR
jgi:hypothetical protein